MKKRLHVIIICIIVQSVISMDEPSRLMTETEAQATKNHYVTDLDVDPQLAQAIIKSAEVCLYNRQMIITGLSRLVAQDVSPIKEPAPPKSEATATSPTVDQPVGSPIIADVASARSRGKFGEITELQISLILS